MQTQCPHCNTQFRITEEQYQIADGLVRCGVCKQTFNAFEINQDDAQLPVEQAAGSNDEADKPNIPPPTSNATATHISAEENASTEPQSELDGESPLEELPLSDDRIPPDNSLNNPFAGLPSSSTPEGHLASLENDASDDTKKNHHNADTRPVSNHSEKNEAEFDLFQTEDDETLSPDLSHSIIPEEYITENSHTVLTGVLWSFAILFLSFTLIAEYLWFNRNQLIQIPQAKPWVEHLCRLTNCEMAALRDPTQIELITRNIYSHPNQKNALIVAVTLINHANFAQPYPLMQIDFSDVRGAVVAARRFDAQTYLQTPKDQLRLLAPETTSSFTMVIQDPGNQAMTYEFNFL